MLEQNYLYKNSQTLKNKYGIKNPQKLYERITHDAAQEAETLRHEPAPPKLDAAYLKRLHWSLFYKSFEWAGQTRDKSFTFADGTKARMPAMRPKGHEVPFAVGEQIHKTLKELEKMLHTKNNLQGLSHQEFAANAAQAYMLLDYAHPFRKGNGRVQRMFMEKLGQVAGHKIDFSVITHERLTQASIEAMQHSNPGPMHDVFEDMTNPQKAVLLKEFLSDMKNAGLGEINNRLVIAAKEGEIYNGIYRGKGAEGFVIETEQGFVVAPKDDLTPEQVKTLQNGAPICFAKANAENLIEQLIPQEKLAPLTHEELFAKVTEDSFVQAQKREVQRLSKTVYGNEKILNAKMELITADPSLGQGFAEQISQDPKSISKLAGVKMYGLKSSDRRHAESHISQLSEALQNYATATQQTREEVLENHTRQQTRLSQSVAKPNKDLQNLFALSPEQQKTALSRSQGLQQQLHNFSRQLHNRLSSEDRQAIEQKDHTRLSCLLGVSESKAKEITNTVEHTREAQCQARSLKVSRSSSLALTG
ncbi:BID domain-containing T4SS effector [Bartonella raoultii]|uniref:BID domain-containing T4SS effector n=1 Tax=Bartonella raoultii TaxID=1457020 RepID=UPI001ABB861E|nr:BID domain-containing T4SS effector [Bartonella raoultii]